MSIPESQMETWANRGAVETAQKTHESIRFALEHSAYYPPGLGFDIYLQGSYKNYTNTRGNSDVDVVAQLDTSFLSDTSALSMNELIRYKSTVVDASYGWSQFQADTYHTLAEHYGADRVSIGKKTIKVKTWHLPADVVVCLQNRQYRRFSVPATSDDFLEGMTFYVPTEHRWVINFPKQHYANGNTKQAGTNEWFRPTVRLFKNMRNRLIEAGQLADTVASSYFIECLLYNVPAIMFGSTYQETFLIPHAYLSRLSDGELAGFVCQNGETLLFGPGPEQWRVAQARQLLSTLWCLWENWR